MQALNNYYAILFRNPLVTSSFLLNQEAEEQPFLEFTRFACYVFMQRPCLMIMLP